MNICRTILTKNLQIKPIQQSQIHVSATNFDIVWRRDRRLPKNPTSSGPLTDLPDYTYMDGRPTPLGVRQKSRLDQQHELAKRIVQGIKEVDFAKQEYQRTLLASDQKRQSILNAKLKPKGRLFSKK